MVSVAEASTSDAPEALVVGSSAKAAGTQIARATISASKHVPTNIIFLSITNFLLFEFRNENEYKYAIIYSMHVKSDRAGIMSRYFHTEKGIEVIA
ncbi:MAG: hypothetical protein U0M72_00995 [Eggerthellaceae bacterium]